MSYKPGKNSPIDPDSTSFRWLERPVTTAEDAYHDLADKGRSVRRFFRSIKEVWDEPDWRKRAARRR
jgi:hypothetical protein